MTYLPGTMFLFDTSALTRMRNPHVADTVIAAIDDGVAATCITVDLEAGFSGQNAQDVERIHQVRDEWVRLSVNESIERRARQVQLLMSQRGLHRAAGAVNILTAAIAEHYRAIIVHYDADFEHIASVTGQQQRWIMPRGHID